MSEKIVTGLFIYPIKSLGGISLTEAKAKMRGLEYDRRWMLVDSEGVFISQRSYPKMALLRPFLNTNSLTVGILNEDTKPIEIPLSPLLDGKEINVKVWDSQCHALCMGQHYDKWFSQALGTDCRLVYLPDHSIRPINQKYAQNNEHVSFADGYPYLILGEAALNELNQRLDQPIPMNRFRPNIVFSGSLPHEEDQWGNFMIGDAKFRGIKPCQRCEITTIDQNTTTINKEPLKTLAKYRRQDNGVIFGLNACWEATSPDQKEVVIRVGDVVNVE